MADQLFSVQDHVIVITGGLGQLGATYATALLERGAKVAIFDSGDTSSALTRWTAELSEGRLIICEVDVTNRQSIEDGLARVRTELGSPTGLVNNAAIDTPPDVSASLENGPFETYPAESWDRVMAVNVKGVFLCCQVIGSEMARMKRGAIINIGSIYGVVSPDQSIYEYRRTKNETFFKPVGYSASKSAIYNLTRYLAEYWGESGVRVNTLTLAGVFNNQDPQFLDVYQARIPIGRMAQATEYVGAVVFLLSTASSYMTGADLRMDGGWTAI